MRIAGLALAAALLFGAPGGAGAGPDEVEEGLARARRLLDRGEIEACREELARLRREHEDDVRPLPLLAWVLLEKADLPGAAAEALERYLERVPGDRYAIDLLGSVSDRAFSRGDYDLARDTARLLMRLDPDEKEHGMRWAWASYRSGGDPGTVRRTLREVIRKAPSYDRAYWLLARSLEDEGRSDEAIRVYRDLLAEHPGDVYARLTLAHRLLWERRDFDGAEEAFRSARELAQSGSPDRRAAEAGLESVRRERARTARLRARHSFLGTVLTGVLGGYALLLLLLTAATRPRR